MTYAISYDVPISIKAYSNISMAVPAPMCSESKDIAH